MFEIEKGSMRFMVFYTGKKILINQVSYPKYDQGDLLLNIRNNLILLSDYYLKNSDADYKKGALKRYFAEKGWNIKIYHSQISVDELGNMRVS